MSIDNHAAESAGGPAKFPQPWARHAVVDKVSTFAFGNLQNHLVYVVNARYGHMISTCLDQPFTFSLRTCHRDTFCSQSLYQLDCTQPHGKASPRNPYKLIR